jgi:hypothetical protein
MNQHIVRELELFLARARRNELRSLVIAASTYTGEVLTGFDITDFEVLGALDLVKYEACSSVLDCQNEKDTQDWDCKTQVETLEDSVVRKTRPKTS